MDENPEAIIGAVSLFSVPSKRASTFHSLSKWSCGGGGATLPLGYGLFSLLHYSESMLLFFLLLPENLHDEVLTRDR